MDEKELLNLIEKGETERVEFKESLRLKDEIGEQVSAFSNSKGGVIFVGVKDTKECIGVQTGKRTVEDLANYIKTHTDNHVFPKISVEEIEDKKVIAVEISESSEKPVFFKGRAYVRVGNSTHKLSASEIRKMAKESGENVCWDSEICKNAKLEDIDGEKVKWFLRKAKYERNFDVEAGTPAKEALERLELIKGEKITNAAILLFGRNPQKFFLQAETRCGRFKGLKVTGRFIDMNVMGGNLFDQIDEIEKFVLRNISKAAWVEHGKMERQEKWEYPLGAIREAVTNAVCHRDYESSANVQARIFDNRMEIWNPGTLPQPLTPEDLKKEHESKPRNKLVAKCFFLTKFIEQWGTGTNKIMELCLKEGLPEPIFKETAGSFVVILRKEITEEYLRGKDLNERQIRAVFYVKDKSRITNKEYQDINGVSKPTASRELKKLADKGILNKIGLTGKGTIYVLAERAHKGLTKGSINQMERYA